MSLSEKNRDKRREERIPGEVKVLVSNPGWKGFRLLPTRNVSAGGAYFHCELKDCPALNSPVVLKVGLRSFQGRIAHTSRITQANGVTLHGFGITIVPPYPAWWATLRMRQLNEATSVAERPVVEKTDAPKALGHALFDLGMRHLQSKNYKLAQQKFEQAQRLGPSPLSEAMLLVCRGYQYLTTAFWHQATESFREALKILPNCREAREGLAEVDARMKRK